MTTDDLGLVAVSPRIGATWLFVGLALSAGACASAGKDGPAGRGIFQKMHREQREAVTVNIDSPHLTGSEARWFWGELEPKEGQFHWDLLDHFLETWHRAGKKVIVNISTCQKQAPEATPAWVFEAGAEGIQAAAPDKFTGNPNKKTKSFPKSTYPVYWDPVYLQKYAAFIQALGRRYDGHPGIEAIEMGLGHNTGFGIAPFDQLLDAYRQHGFTRDRWLKTMLQITDIYREAFPRTPLMVVTGPIEHLEWQDPDLKRFCEAFAGRQVILFCHNLRGHAEWKTKNRIPQIYAELHERTKTALGCDNPTWQKNRKGGAGNKFYGDIWTIVKYAVGGTDGLPESGISYLLLYSPDIAACTPKNAHYIKEYEDAVKWLLPRLK